MAAAAAAGKQVQRGTMRFNATTDSHLIRLQTLDKFSIALRCPRERFIQKHTRPQHSSTLTTYSYTVGTLQYITIFSISPKNNAGRSVLSLLILDFDNK